jgi:DNA-binding XRE family transcriptional regulator
MNFHDELTSLLNKFSIENESDTPDWILAKYIAGCLDNWNQSVAARDKWWGHKTWSQNESIESSEVL